MYVVYVHNTCKVISFTKRKVICGIKLHYTRIHSVPKAEAAAAAEFVHDDFALLAAIAGTEDLLLTSPPPSPSSSSDICMVKDVQHIHFSNTTYKVHCNYII